MKLFNIILFIALGLVGNVLAQQSTAVLTPSYSTEWRTDMERLKQKNAERCANPEFKEYYEMSPCLVEEISFKHISDTTKITPEQKKVFAKVRAEIDASLRERARIDREAGNGFAAETALRFLIPQNDANNLDIYNGKINWGDYNTKRREIFNNFIAEMRKGAKN